MLPLPRPLFLLSTGGDSAESFGDPQGPGSQVHRAASPSCKLSQQHPQVKQVYASTGLPSGSGVKSQPSGEKNLGAELQSTARGLCS